MTTPDFEKMFDIEGLLKSEDQVRYTEAVRSFANAVENVVVHLGVSRDDPLCASLVKVAEDLVRARRDAEQDAIQYAESIKEATALLHATQRAQLRTVEEKGRAAADAYITENIGIIGEKVAAKFGPRFNAAVRRAVVAYCCLAATIAGILGLAGGWCAHEWTRPLWEPPSVMHGYYPPAELLPQAPPLHR